MKKDKKIVLMNDNIIFKKCIILNRRKTMKKFVTFIQDVLLINDNNTGRVGLSQFKNRTEDFSINKNSITSKDVKLSDLLRRV